MKVKHPELTVYLKRATLFLIDGFICILAGILAGYVIHLGFSVFGNINNIIFAVLIASGLQVASMALFGGYRYIMRYADIHYNVRIVLIFIVNYVLQILIIGGLFDFKAAALFSIVQTGFAFAGIVISRFCYQFLVDFILKQHNKTNGRRVMIIGGGWTGKRVLQDLSRVHAKYFPVCIIDDDIEKHHMLMDNVPIVGDTRSIEVNVKKYRIDKIIFAIPSACLETRNRIIASCLTTGKEVNILPNIGDLVAKADILSLVRKVEIGDLLQRSEVKFDNEEIKKFISGKVCLVTGGGGSIGSELCRQIAKFNPEKVIILDVYENSAFDIWNQLNEAYPELAVQVEIASVTDERAMDKLFKTENIDLIFHAAAHKHVPLMEHNPEESVKNNVVGTWVIAKLAAKYKITKMVMISTDKAVNPTNVMGATKRFCEKIVEYWATQTKFTKYSVTRFGNVLGSNGSVVHIFNRQIASGGPVKVTHPEIIRYFMTIPEAVSLILQSGTFAKGGEVFVLDMGDPVKILTLAENMIRLAGFTPNEDIKIEFSGLRPGEKLFEELLMNEEGLQKTPNDKIYIGNQSYIADKNLPEKYNRLVSAAQTNDGVSVIHALCDAVETYTPDLRYHSQVIIEEKQSDNELLGECV